MSDTEQRHQAPLPSNDRAPSGETKTSADGWWRTQSATLALLKHAYHLLGTSERRIAEQDRRIRELEDLAATDPLTGLMNRRGFERFFELEQARIHRRHSPGALLILIDLDLFKPVNDTYGHAAGDACLRALSQKMLQSIRMLDGAARLGGDEFALLLTQLPPESGAAHLEKIRALLAETTVDWQGKKITFSASVGAAVVTEETSFAAAYAAADATLYANKKRRPARTG
ncbi:MAG: diguanylate cyclase [Alphaproteobacteria bacterium]|nr:GGDEF domain-containing protein [Alphaproteobacteria bacterium]MDE2336259.1 diguanylate cyclase [Alphaproteobacteria bacterium]